MSFDEQHAAGKSAEWLMGYSQANADLTEVQARYAETPLYWAFEAAFWYLAKGAGADFQRALERYEREWDQHA